MAHFENQPNFVQFLEFTEASKISTIFIFQTVRLCHMFQQYPFLTCLSELFYFRVGNYYQRSYLILKPAIFLVHLSFPELRYFPLFAPFLMEIEHVINKVASQPLTNPGPWRSLDKEELLGCMIASPSNKQISFLRKQSY